MSSVRVRNRFSLAFDFAEICNDEESGMQASACPLRHPALVSYGRALPHRSRSSDAQHHSSWEQLHIDICILSISQISRAELTVAVCRPMKRR